MKSPQERIEKDFSVFDCDGHINDPLEIWADYVEPEYRDLVKRAYWRDHQHAILNGRTEVSGGAAHEYREQSWMGLSIGGPGMSKQLMRRLLQMKLTPEQKAYLDHRGAYEPQARVKEMDLMGIDQAMVIPTWLLHHTFYVEDAEGAHALVRAYNNWAADYCKTAPERLFAAGLLPTQNPVHTVRELRRLARSGFRLALIRPIDALGNYPNRVFRDASGGATTMDAVFRTFEEAGLVLGMHTFSPATPPEPSATVASPGQFVTRANEPPRNRVSDEPVSFMFEAMAWLTQVLLSGFLDRYPKLTMGIFESNATWLLPLLERCDHLFKLYANERRQPAKRLPSEAYYQQCFHAFEGDETPVFRRWDRYQEIGIWSSDTYHLDFMDAWDTIRRMEEVEVPVPVQAKLLGDNARRMYGITGKVFVTQEPESIPRPPWFPTEEEIEGWWRQEMQATRDGLARARQSDSRAG